jgi:DNA-binding IclR family transcriptional regulator
MKTNQGSVVQADEAATARRGQKVQAAETGLEVLKALGALGGSASLSVLAAKLEIHPAKVHRYLGSLISAGFVSQHREGARYVLGVEALTLGLAAQRQQSALKVTEQLIAGLSEALEVTVGVAVLGNRGPVIVLWEEPLQPIVVNVRVGFVMPMLWSATGRAFAAFVPFDQVKELIELELRDASSEQKRVLPNLDEVQKMLAQIRSTGYASVTDTLLRGASGMAAPVFNHKGHVEAVVALLGVSGILDVSPEGPNGRALLEATTAASRLMGYQQAQN